MRRDGYVLWQASPKPGVILIGTGSEVHMALEAAKLLQESLPRLVEIAHRHDLGDYLDYGGRQNLEDPNSC